MAAKYHIGTSGWHYEDWRERFYPVKLAGPQWLKYYAGHFTTVELNYSFYRLPAENAWAYWRDSTPLGFIFAVKASRFITHVKRLKNTEEAVANFISRARLLQGKLGPILYQLPPSMKRDVEILEGFIEMLPADVRHVFEFRHDSWFDHEIYSSLERHNIGFCIYDMPGFRTPVVQTAPFAYVRFHGSGRPGGLYSDEELQEYAVKIMGLEAGEVYVYFNNDAQAFAVRNADMLRGFLLS